MERTSGGFLSLYLFIKAYAEILTRHPIALLLISCSLLLGYLVWKATTSELRSLPGPFLARFSIYYRFWLVSTGRGPIKYLELHEKYGSVVRTGPNHVSLSDPSMISILYDMKNTFLKSQFYDIFKPLYQGAPMDTIFTTKNSVTKKGLKNLLMTNMTSCPQDYNSIIILSIETFVQCVREKRGKSVDFTTWPFFWAFDVTYAIIFGGHFGFMETHSDFNRMIDGFTRMARYAAMLGQVPKWIPLFLGNNIFMTFMRRFQNFPDPTQQFFAEVEKRIEIHGREPHKCNNTFLCRIVGGIDLKINGPEHYEIVNVLFESFFAAAVEIAVTIRTIFYCLLTNKAVCDRLIREIRADDNSTKPWESLLRLPYLSAVIKESLRLYTSNCPPMERIVPSSGMSANGYYIPEGTIVSVAHYVTHRDTEVFGNDAHSFRPERWLEADPFKLKRMDHNFMAFGKGSRVCSGRELGMLELRMFTIGVLMNFDIEWASANPQPVMKQYWIMELFGLDVKFREIIRDTLLTET